MNYYSLRSTLIIAALLSQTPFLNAAENSQYYNIPAGSLTLSLTSFAAKSGILLTTDAKLTQGKQASPLQGDYTVEEGLSAILQGSGLTVKQQSNDTFIVIPMVSQNTANSVTLQAISVTGTPQSRYNSRAVSTGDRFEKDLIDTPRTVDIIPEQLLEDTQAQEMQDVYKMAPNVVNSDGYGGTREDYIIRGFRRPADIYRNGVRLKTGRRFDPATVDNIQIIKGPVADIGQMMPGGLVNIVTKKPQYQAEHSISTSFDEHGKKRAVLDTTGPLGDSDNFAYRIIGSYENTETFRELSKVDREFLSSSLLWLGDRGAYVDVNHEYTNEDRSLDRGYVTRSLDGSQREVVFVPVNLRYDEAFSLNKVESNIVEIDAGMPLANSDWMIESKLFYNQEDTDDVRTEVLQVAEDGTLARRVQGNNDRSLDTMFARIQAKREFFDWAAKLVTGFEYHRQEEQWTNFTGNIQVGGTVTDPHSYDIIDDSANPASISKNNITNDSYGPFAQIDFSPIEQLDVTLGVRQEYYSGDFDRTNLNDLTQRIEVHQPKADQFSKSANILWHSSDNLSLYASYSDTFIAQSIIGNQSVAVLNPQEGRQIEIGSKWSTLDNRLLLSLALFDIKQTNVVETVNGEPELTGGIDTQGIEVSLVGNPSPGWNIRTALGLLDAEMVSDDDELNGNLPRNVPKNTASLWNSYEFQSKHSALQGLGLGFGITHVGNRYGDNQHSYELGDYTLVDLGAWYYIPVTADKKIRLDFGVKNVTDEEYVVASGGTYRNSVGAPRTFFGSASYKF